MGALDLSVEHLNSFIKPLVFFLGFVIETLISIRNNLPLLKKAPTFNGSISIALL